MDANMVGRYIGDMGNHWRDQLARMCIRRRIAPLWLTSGSLGVSLLAGLLLGTGMAANPAVNWPHRAAAVVLLLAGVLDLLDDMVARLSEHTTKFAAFSDSVFDLYADLAIFAGIIAYFAGRDSVEWIVVAAIAFTGVVMMRYAQARAESLLPGRYHAGYMQRPEWLATLIVACLLNRLPVGVALIAFFTNLATFHRIWDTRQTAHNLEHPDEAGRGYGSRSAPAALRFVRSLIFWTYPRQSWQHDALSLVILICLVVSLLAY